MQFFPLFLYERVAKSFQHSVVCIGSDSYALFSCRNDYVNIGGNLNVTCNADDRWGPFPKCVPQIPALTCRYSSSIRTLANGYSSNLDSLLLSTEDQAESRSFIDYRCTPPYTLTGNSRMR